MYSKKILEELGRKNIDIGDRIRIVSSGATYEGLLMPRVYSGEQDIIVIKLSSGYNTGMIADSIELLEKAASRPRENTPESNEKGEITILGCGGTIASKIEYKTGAVYPSISPKELRTAFPDLGRWSIRSKQLFSLFSEDMNAVHWRILADSIEEEIKEGSKGIVVMHGTDTMTYTAAAISFMLQRLPVPVIIAGSQRSSDRPSSDNKLNLVNSVFSATKDFGEVTVCMHASTNDELCYLHRGCKVRKMHTSRRDAFHSINSSPLFAVDYRSGRFDPLSEHKKRNKEGLIARKELNNNVALLYVHPNMRPDIISKMDSYDGLVLIGTGLGHVPTNAFGDKKVKGIFQPIKELIDSGIPVVMSSQCISGRICMRVYTNGRLLRDAGVIGDGADWTPEAAYVKLCWVLGQTKKMDEVAKLMMNDIAGEITPRSIIEEKV